jgi:2-hydroxy-6-oxo-6-(2'-carboxyphenyl)-hexa-2,4-dienoate hydrolase
MTLEQYGEKWVSVEGIRTRYFDAGEGEPVLMIHGGRIGDESAPGNAEEFEYNFPAIVDAGYRAISVDKLGQGYTDNPLHDEGYSLRGQAEHMAQFIRVLDAGPVHLIGHSRGAYIACRVALDFPDLVRSCVLIDTNSSSPGPGRNEIVFACNPHPAGTRAASEWVFRNYSFRGDHVTASWLDQVAKILAQKKYEVAIRKMKAEGLTETVFNPMLSEDREELFARLAMEGLLRPTLLIWAFNDPTATLDLGYGLFDLIGRHTPRCQMHIVNEAGHFSFREQPAVFNRVVVEFLAGVAHGV